jgi:sugar/nucleoside kinase (ribokinase family)
MPRSESQRVGIASGGNWIVDRVKTVDRLPGRGMLGNITAETLSTGGAPANVLADLARLRAPFPLTGVGIVGNDADGGYIRATFEALGVDVSLIRSIDDAPTSFTDVMNEEGTGERMFFHHRGANARFGREHVPVRDLACRIFHLGYVLLLDSMDSIDPDFGTVAAHLLYDLQQQGIKTSLDVVSEESDRFKTLVPPALKYVDYLILNEIEIGRVIGVQVRNSRGELDSAALADAVEEIHDYGDMSLVAVHMPEGVYLRDGDGYEYSCGSLELPPGFIAGAVGAGDAFCAGMLYGLHEGWDYPESAKLGTCCAAASLSAGGATEGVKPLADVLALADRFSQKQPPVTV